MKRHTVSAYTMRKVVLRGALGAVSALFLVGLLSSGTTESTSPFPLAKVGEVRFMTKDLCAPGTLGTTIPLAQTMSYASPFAVGITEIETCISTRGAEPPEPENPLSANIQIDDELLQYVTIATSLGYGTRLTADVARTDAVAFNMSVVSTAGAQATNGRVMVGSERLDYDTKTATSFHIIARAQVGSQADDHEINDRVYASAASGDSPNIETAIDDGDGITAGDATITVDSTAGAVTPGVLQVDDERIAYTITNGTTLAVTERGAGGTTAASHANNATVALPKSPPFTMEVGDATAEGTSGDFTALSGSHTICLSREQMTIDTDHADTQGDGLSGSADSFRVTARDLSTLDCANNIGAQAHEDPGEGLRDATRILLQARALPEYDFQPANEITPAALHNTGVTVAPPETHTRCISRVVRTDRGAIDDVETRSRCYVRDINPPDPPGSEDGSGPYFKSTSPLDVFTFHSVSNGGPSFDFGSGFNENTGELEVAVNISLLGQCIAFGGLIVNVVTTRDLDKTAGNTDYGSYRINVWNTDTTCQSTPDFILGEFDQIDAQGVGTNAKTTALADDSDFDGDGCQDFLELGADEGDGGKRDPFNPFDYYDANHDGAINIFDDILEIAAGFGGSSNLVDQTPVPKPNYAPEKDRGANLGPWDWNRKGPNGSINIFDDILVAAGQFGNSCTHDTDSVHENYAPIGPIQWFFGDHP